ncbi:glycosyltransferase-like domain-containing protein 1 [Gigantopelta aegis]|uniref:glycosyltransferase-like domain-containing protein 1 n=1 Tax=Gigantopelta aegis TaxID=1735272 RepID=UPI001B88D523|nr:glycosyltransferase-like domain-containing protein 1 [Gigantopelta aegis]
MAEILLIEPFYGGSHKQLIDLLCTLPNHALYTLPAKKWHWRARTSALYFSQIIPYSHKYRVLFTSSVLNLAELVALRPDLVSLKKVLYFHENQLVYPVRKQQERDFQYGYNQILSCLVADEVVFNSNYNKDSFLSNIQSFLKLIPDHRPAGLVNVIRPKCRVIYFPLCLLHITDSSSDLVHDDDGEMLTSDAALNVDKKMLNILKVNGEMLTFDTALNVDREMLKSDTILNVDSEILTSDTALNVDRQMLKSDTILNVDGEMLTCYTALNVDRQILKSDIVLNVDGDMLTSDTALNVDRDVLKSDSILNGEMLTSDTGLNVSNEMLSSSASVNNECEELKAKQSTSSGTAIDVDSQLSTSGTAVDIKTRFLSISGTAVDADNLLSASSSTAVDIDSRLKTCFSGTAVDVDRRMLSSFSGTAVDVDKRLHICFSGTAVDVDSRLKTCFSGTAVDVDSGLKTCFSGTAVDVDSRLKTCFSGTAVDVDSTLMNSLSGTAVDDSGKVKPKTATAADCAISTSSGTAVDIYTQTDDRKECETEYGTDELVLSKLKVLEKKISAEAVFDEVVRAGGGDGCVKCCQHGEQKSRDEADIFKYSDKSCHNSSPCVVHSTDCTHSTHSDVPTQCDSVLTDRSECGPTVMSSTDNVVKLASQEDGRVLHILWAHRWEHDKDPATFFNVLYRLQDEGCRFKVSVLGEYFSQVPEVFVEAQERLSTQIVTWGYQTKRDDYYTALRHADVSVSTAHHEFFGVAMLESVSLGCYPLCPNRLVYPEIFPAECLYGTSNQLFKRLRTFCQNPHLSGRVESVISVDRFSWKCLKRQYEELLQS